MKRVLAIVLVGFVLAEAFSRVASALIEKAKNIEEEARQEGNELDEGDNREVDRSTLRKRCLPMEDLKALNVEAMRVIVPSTLSPLFQSAVHTPIRFAMP